VTGSAATTSQLTGVGDLATASKIRSLNNSALAKNKGASQRLDGTEYGGQKLSRGALYLMLQNRIYRGEIIHQGKSFLGDHPAIIEKPLWDGVQAVLAANAPEPAHGPVI